MSVEATVPRDPGRGMSGVIESFRSSFGPTEALAPMALILLIAVAGIAEPSVLSVSGITLLLSSAIPLVFAALAQMCIITLGDIDLGTGYFIGLVSAVVAVHLNDSPWIAVAILLGLVALYAGAGALVQLRQIPALIVTLGASFIWLGLGLSILPTPGGTVPGWLVTVMTVNTPVIPYPVIVAALAGGLAYVLLIRTPYSAVLRGAGSNPDAVRRAGWSLVRVRMTAYGLAAVFGILGGLALAGITSSGDTQASANYTLLAIASTILGGGRFTGGRAVPFGAVIGALAISVAGSMLALIGVSSNFQTGVQGLILITVLAGRIVTDRSRS